MSAQALLLVEVVVAVAFLTIAAKMQTEESHPETVVIPVKVRDNQ
jgi:hypothetical protein